MPVTVTTPAIGLHVDALDTVSELQRRCEAHWKAALLGGQRAKGGALPANSKGQPMGRGDGGIAREWTSGPVVGTKVRAEASSSPGQEGGHYYAVQRMVDADANPASIEGKVAGIISDVVDRAADRAIR